MTHDSAASITGERKRRNKKKEEGWRERKMEILFWFSSFILSFLFFFFFFLMKVYLSHLDVISAHGFILHVDYYFLSCWFFFLNIIYIYIYTRRWEVEAQLYSDNIT